MTYSEIRSSFTSVNRHIVDEGEFDLTSVGVDIGSSTSHLIFSRLHLEHTGSRYRIVEREVLAESRILFTPYLDGGNIDTEALEAFIDEAYRRAGIRRQEVDAGALILTGTAVQRRNARAIAEVFAAEAGRFVAVSAGDGLESTMAAHGSGAVALSVEIDGVVMNVDIGGGTTKVAICRRGRVDQITAVDVGARLLAMDSERIPVRIEPASRAHARGAGVLLDYGNALTTADLDKLADRMAECLAEAMGLKEMTSGTRELLRLPPLAYEGQVDAVTFSGGVSEFIYGSTDANYGDLGLELAGAVRQRVEELGIPVMKPRATLRATVIGASQYTMQVSGNTIFINPVDAVPLRNVPVIAPNLELGAESIDSAQVAAELRKALARVDFSRFQQTVALAFKWCGSATFARLQKFCTGLAEGMKELLVADAPLVLVSDGDIGGLLGLHLVEEMGISTGVISIDGIELNEFDFIDIGSLIPSSGAVPVVIKSLVFPNESKEGAKENS